MQEGLPLCCPGASWRTQAWRPQNAERSPGMVNGLGSGLSARLQREGSPRGVESAGGVYLSGGTGPCVVGPAPQKPQGVDGNCRESARIVAEGCHREGAAGQLECPHQCSALHSRGVEKGRRFVGRGELPAGSVSGWGGSILPPLLDGSVQGGWSYSLSPERRTACIRKLVCL